MRRCIAAVQAVSVKYAEFCALTASRLGAPPLQHPPATPLLPGQRLRVGYVSSDFGNHPLSHLMASVFGLHDRSRLEVRSWFRAYQYPIILRKAVSASRALRSPARLLCKTSGASWS